MQEEIWKDIPDYEGKYQISNLGRVKSLKRKYVLEDTILKTPKCSGGYMVVNLSKKILRVHQLMAITFLGHTPCGYKLVVDHIDNDKLNNKLDNLQLITHRENLSKDSTNTSGYTGVFLRPNKKFIARIWVNSKYINLGIYDTPQEASKVYQERKRNSRKV